MFRLICAFKSGVKGVKVVIAHFGELVVRVKCLVDSYRKHYVAIVPADL